ncbi:MAG: universal stress protein, partial [Actinomycetota bacterium]
MYGTIAVGTDGSETARVAEGVALALAAASSGRVLFVSAFTDGVARRRSVEALEAARERAKNADVAAESEPIQAEPAEGIVELADRHDAELLVIGDVGMSGRRTLRLGGVTDGVSHA